MRTLFTSLTLILLSLTALSGPVHAAGGDPCQKDGTLKGWAEKAGYSAEDCAIPTDGSTDSTTDTSGTDTSDICGNDGSLKGWARKAGYSSDSCQSGTDTTEPVVENTAPSISILSPTDGYTADDGNVITFTGSARDAEDGDLSASIAWSSSLDGAIAASTALSVGSHTITSTVTDSNGATATAQIVVDITEVVTVPTQQTVTLSWQAPTQREDGSALTQSEIGGYEIYMVADSGAEGIITVTDGSATTHTLEVRTGDVYHFAIASIDSDGAQSILSDPVSISLN